MARKLQHGVLVVSTTYDDFEGGSMNKHIVLFNRGILPTYLVVHFNPNKRQWDISEIEIYADEQLQVLICDSITFNQLPSGTKASLTNALNEARRQNRVPNEFAVAE
jgi:hypothetical protein